ncbi:hypothetical protein GCM10022222_51910 [Amycolatopsis ultiminotia]|uniref:Uncharacterized protein n=1 Tax=Amycolatopsis ultiminotia TaxID=543629 RepID=A0ABP6X6F6_9PSEU
MTVLETMAQTVSEGETRWAQFVAAHAATSTVADRAPWGRKGDSWGKEGEFWKHGR